MQNNYSSPTDHSHSNKGTDPNNFFYRIPLLITLIAIVLLSCSTFQNIFGGGLDSPVLELLRFVPDSRDNRRWVTYGDADAWHTSWDIPRITDLDDLDDLDRESRTFWMRILPEQTIPPQSLGMQYLMVDDLSDIYGFDVFMVDRYLEAGFPPETMSVLGYNFDQNQIADALLDSGYDSESLDSLGDLYSINDDYDLALDAPTRTGQMGNLNRIAVLDNLLLTAKATEIIETAVDAYFNEDSLADNPDYIAALTAIENLDLSETSELVGMIFMDGNEFPDKDAALESVFGASDEAIEQLQENLENYLDPALPEFSLAAFATRHTEGETYLILAVVFPEDEDPETAAEILADRLEDYASVRGTGRDITEYYDLEMYAGSQAAGLPVAVVVLRVDDPPPTPEDEPLVNSFVLSWFRMISNRDTLFLVSE